MLCMKILFNFRKDILSCLDTLLLVQNLSTLLLQLPNNGNKMKYQLIFSYWI